MSPIPAIQVLKRGQYRSWGPEANRNRPAPRTQNCDPGRAECVVPGLERISRRWLAGSIRWNEPRDKRRGLLSRGL